MTRDKLISRIEAFASERGIKPATVTSRAVGNSRLYRRLKRGGSCSFDTIDRLIAFMDASAGGPAPKTPREPLRAAS